MKKRHVVSIFGLAGAMAAWMLWPTSPKAASPQAAPPKSTVGQPTSSLAVQLNTAVKIQKSPEVVAPKVAPAPKPAEQPVADPQRELSSALADLIKLGETGDLVTAWQTYAEPDFFADIPVERHIQVDDNLRQLATSVPGQMRVQAMMQVLNSFTTQNPTYNDTGDVATYPVTGPVAATGMKEFHFQRVDGRWYIADQDLNRVGQLLGL